MKSLNLALVVRALLLSVAPCLYAPLPAAGQSQALPASPGKAIEVIEPFDFSSTLQPQASAPVGNTYQVRLRLDDLRSLEAGQYVILRYSPTGQWEGVVHHVERRSRDSFSVFGNIGGSLEGSFLFTVDHAGLIGSIQIPSLHLQADLRNLQDDAFALRCGDSTKTHGFACGVPELAASSPGFAEPGAPPLSCPKDFVTPQHDVMVLYTQGLLNDFPKYFPNTPLDTAIQYFVDFANQAYLNSGVQLRLRLAYRGLVDPAFSEAGRDRHWLLDNLINKTNVELNHVHGWRSYYHADLVCLLYSFDTQATGGGGGLASLLTAATFNTGNPANWYDSAFSVVEGLWEPSSVAPPVSGMVPTEFAHEIGHNQGLNHDCHNSDQPYAQVTSSAFGWRFVGNSGNKYVTIMAYLTDEYTNASPIQYFSNPALSFDGQPIGNATSAGCPGTTGARNAEALNLTADFMSRLCLNPLDPWVDFAYNNATQNGRYEAPWKTLAAAVNDLPTTFPSGTPEPPTITLKGPATSGPLASGITINKRVTLVADHAPVTLGR